MKCDQAREWIPDLLDRTIDEAREVLVRQHLIECKHCAQEMEAMRRTWELLGSMQWAEPPSWFHESLMAQIAIVRENRMRTAQQAWWRRGLMPDTPGRRAAVTAAAAFIFITLLSVFFNGPQGTVQGFVSTLQMLAGRRTTPPPVDVMPPVPVIPQALITEPSLEPDILHEGRYDILTLTAKGTSHPLRATVWVLPAGASYNPSSSLNTMRTVWSWSRTLDPGQMLRIPFDIPDNLEAGMTVSVVVEWEGLDRPHRFLLYLPASAHGAYRANGTVRIETGTELHEALRQIAEASGTAFWVDAHLIGRLDQDILEASTLVALQEVLKGSGAACERKGNLYLIRMKP